MHYTTVYCVKLASCCFCCLRVKWKIKNITMHCSNSGWCMCYALRIGYHCRLVVVHGIGCDNYIMIILLYCIVIRTSSVFLDWTATVGSTIGDPRLICVWHSPPWKQHIFVLFEKKYFRRKNLLKILGLLELALWRLVKKVF